MRRLRPHLTFANVLSCCALFVALGGVSYAALTLPRNSVGTAQLRDGQVKARDLGRGAVTSAKVADGSLTARDFRRDVLAAGSVGPRGADGAQGPVGPAGPAGTPGGDGAAGRDGAALVQTALFSGNQSLSQASFTVVPLANASWVQPGNALDFFFARVRIIRNTTTSCDDGGESPDVTLGLAGVPGSIQTHTLLQASGTHVIGLKPPFAWLVPPGAPTTHRLEATARSNCGDPGGWRVQELRVDVVRAVGG
jgi:hypothetical protein